MDGWVPTAAIDGIDIYYEVHGAGSRLLNISGSGSDLRRTYPDRSPLNKRLEVLSYDQRGLGRSAKPDGEYTMADYADDAAALLAHVGWDRCHVMGTSFGGMVALNLAVRHPGVIGRLVVNCTSPGGAYSSFPLHDIASMDPEDAFELRMRLYDRRWDPAAAEPIPGLGVVYDAIVQQARTTPAADVAAGVARQLGARRGHDVVAHLPSIGHETLVCAGVYDELAPMINAEVMAEQMPNATLRTFDGGHFFPYQDRSAFPAIVEFVLGPD